MRILFLCNGNSARSQMAEALLRHVGNEDFEAFSAGKSPDACVHPLAIVVPVGLKVSLGGRRFRGELRLPLAEDDRHAGSDGMSSPRETG